MFDSDRVAVERNGEFGEIEFDFDRLVVDERRRLVDDLARRGDKVEAHPIQFHLARLDLGKVEDVVDQAEQVLGVAIDRLQSVEFAFLQVRAELADEALGESHDRIHRRAQFVRHVGEKLAFHSTGAFGVATGRLRARDCSCKSATR